MLLFVTGYAENIEEDYCSSQYNSPSCKQNAGGRIISPRHLHPVEKTHIA